MDLAVRLRCAKEWKRTAIKIPGALGTGERSQLEEVRLA